MTSAAAPTATSAQRQPGPAASRARIGTNTSWPVAVAAVSAPSTRPRRWLNQRVATTAPRTLAVIPVPKPTTTPHRTISCHGSRICVATRIAPASRVMASATMRRIPRRSAIAAQNGPVRP